MLDGEIISLTNNTDKNQNLGIKEFYSYQHLIKIQINESLKFLRRLKC